MKFFSAAQMAAAMDYRGLVDALRDAFRGHYITPVRHHHTISLPDQSDATLLLMPSWQDTKQDGASHGAYAGVKMVTVYPDNEQRLQKPSILGAYMLMDAESGEVKAIMDGPTITVWRTACASALAADFLAKPFAKSMTMIGTGALSGHLIRAHASVRPIETVMIWGRNPEKARAVADSLSDLELAISLVEDRKQAVEAADIVSCATMSPTPMVEGAWLKPGAHLDLVGAYRPDMRESDDECIRRSRVYVDTLAGATKEGGDITQPMAAGILDLDEIRGDLFGLCQNKCSARWGDDEITLFKSVGTAIEDLAAAKYVYEMPGQD